MKRCVLKDFILKNEGIPNFSLKLAYAKLSNSVQFYNKSLQQLAVDMRYSYDGVTTYNTLVTMIPTADITLIYKLTFISQEVLVGQNFMPNSAISKPLLFPGDLEVSPWAVGSTYFRPIFQNYLAKLYESGIERKMHSFVLSVMQYRELNIFVKQTKNMSMSKEGTY